MSLLLDALKKAADDKRKASQGDSTEPVSSVVAPSEPDTTANLTAETAVTSSTVDLQQGEVEPALQMIDEKAGEESSEITAEIIEELTLDAIETNTVESSEAAAAIEKAGDAHSETDELTLKQDSKAASYTVSDEALSMLIYKTNREVKQSKRLVTISVLLVSLVILISGGIYYYMDIQAEIAILERKHQIAMMSMASKTNKEKTPEKSEIIRNLVGESDLEDKVQYAKKHMAKGKNSQQIKHRSAAGRPATALKNNKKTSAAASAVSFQKTNKADPVAEKLEEAWAAYEAARYDRAKTLYKDVLIIEDNNRDALLGLGAIAVVEKDNVAARNTYILLLQQDPRDPIAIAAIASLRNSEVSTEADEKYLLNMLQRNPDDAHLNFALGNIYAQQNKWKPAQQSYFNAWQRDNENADYIFNLAVSMDQLGKRKQAADLYRDCLSKSGDGQVVFSREAVQKRITELSGL